MYKLSDKQIADFEENGFLILAEVFNQSEIDAMRKESNLILELIVNSSIANDRHSGRLDIKTMPNGNHIVRKIQPINDLSLLFSKMSQDPRLIEPMRQLMNDEPILMEEKLNYKQAFPYKIKSLTTAELDDIFPIHSDWAYYKAQEYPQNIISSAILIDDCNANSGPLRFWAGTNKVYLEHENIDIGLQVKKGLLDFKGGKEILAPAGSVLLFNALTIHNSNSNTSGKPRRLMIYSHHPKKSNIPFDVRNGYGRLSESPYEWEYQRKKESGICKDVFVAP